MKEKTLEKPGRDTNKERSRRKLVDAYQKRHKGRFREGGGGGEWKILNKNSLKHPKTS